MAHDYLGVDEPSAIVPGSPTFGYGEFPIPVVTDDQDDRDAASADIGIEAVTDRTNFIFWRVLNIIEGGIYNFIATISTLNAWIFRGSATFKTGSLLRADAGSNVDLYGTSTLKSTGTLTTDSGSTLTANGNVALNANTTISSSAAVLRQCFERRTGNGAWTGSRVQTGSNANVAAFDASTADATRCPVLSATRTYTVIDPGGSTAEGVEHTFERTIVGTSTFALVINDGVTSLPLAQLVGNTDSHSFVKIRWTGAAWYVDSWGSYAGNPYVTV